MDAVNISRLSSLLLDDEKVSVIENLGIKCQIWCSAIVQLFVYDNGWDVLLSTGISVFTKDNSRRSYFMQIFIPGEKVFEQEIYGEFIYDVSTDFFHQFEVDNKIYGLNFADNEEASVFGLVLTEFIRKKKRKHSNSEAKKLKESLRNEKPNQQNSAEVQSVNILENPTGTIRQTSKKLKKQKVRKSEIGNPENFVHLHHVGFGSQTDSTSGSHDGDLLSYILEMSHITSKELEDPKTKESFMNYIEEKGGIHKVYKRLKAKAVKMRPSVKGQSTPAKPKISLPSQTTTTDSPSLTAPRPIQHSVSMVENKRSPYNSPPTPPPKNINKQPLTSPSLCSPPPPPPPPTTTKPTTPFMRSPSLPVGRQTEDSEQTKDPLRAAPFSKSDLLSEIRNPGIRLRKVECSAEDERPPAFSNPVVNALQNKLNERSLACRGDSSEDDDSDSDDSNDDDSDEWS